VNKRRGGFTMLELVTVIGIIMVLIALLVVGVGHVVGGGKERQTKVTLENLRNMVAEMEVSVGLTKQPRVMWVKNQQLIAPNATFDVWHFYDYTTRTNPPFFGALFGDPTNGVGPLIEGRPERFTSDAIANTQQVMGIIQSIPANQTILSNLPADSFMEATPAGNAKLTPGGAKPNPPILVDGWKNPILFVPAAGIWVTVTDPANPQKVVAKLVKSSDSRPFWVSGGQDGFITDPVNPPTKAYGEDNHYSFEH
jgi:type II secretory pathway pseudopilin PulG